MPAKSRSGRSSKVTTGGAKTKEASASSVKEIQPSHGTSTTTASTTTTENTTQNEKDQPNNLFEKVIQPGFELTPEEALAAAHWIRQILALFVGTVFGVVQLKGFPPIMSYAVICFTAPYSLLSAMHPLDLDEINEKGAIQTEGFFPATALFFLTWIISYTIFLPATS